MTNSIQLAANCVGAWRRKQTLWIGIALLGLANISACSLTPKDVWVYIDNVGHKPLEVTVDGQPAAKVAPGQFAKLVYPSGEHKLLIKAGDQVLCDLVRNLAQSDRIGVTRKYLFNPDKLTRYQTYEVKYGVNRLDGVMQAGLLSYQKDPQLKRQYIYRQLLKEIKLVPSDAWNDVTEFDYVLTAPPNHIITKGTTRRTVLSRIGPRFAERMERMAKIDTPTDEDIDSLNALIDEMLDEAL
jgi:hypothetical protein